MEEEVQIQGYEYFDQDNESLRDPNTYLNKTPLEMVQQFARCNDQVLNHTWVKDSNKELFRVSLIQEEYGELLSSTTPENQLKELADLIIVTYGYGATFGWNVDEAVRRVHASNMSKNGPDGKPIKDENGKVLKGPNYKAPDLSDLV